MHSKISRGFTLIELLVVIAIIALLIGIMVPVLGRARHTARVMADLNNLRSLQQAQWMYMIDNKDRLITVGLGHGGDHNNEQAAWIGTLSHYWTTSQTQTIDGQERSQLMARSPLDTSPHWGPEGVPVEGVFRRSSYGINDFLTANAHLEPGEGPYTSLKAIPRPAATIQFLIMAYEGEFAVADHTHIHDWDHDEDGSEVPEHAAEQVQTNAAGGPKASWDSRSNWGFLDGHAVTRPLEGVYTSHDNNNFHPAHAK